MTLFMNLLQDFIDVALLSSIAFICVRHTQSVSRCECVCVRMIDLHFVFIYIHINWPLARENVTDNRIFVAFVFVSVISCCIVTGCIHGFDVSSFSSMCIFLWV